MSRPVLVLLIALLYVLVVWGVRRIRLLRGRRRSIPPERFRPFDHRAVLDELEELYRAGLPAVPGPPEPAGPAEVPELGLRVVWWRPGVWAEPPGRASATLRQAAAHVAVGEDDQVDRLIDPAQEAAVDQQFTSLGIHAFLDRLYRGDLEGAERVLQRLPDWTNGRISSRVVAKHQGQIELLRAQRAAGAVARQAGRTARRHLARAGATAGFAEPGTRALWAHVTLAWGLNLLNLEVQLFRVDRAIRRALGEAQTSAVLFYELAHVSALRGRGGEATEHLARALYYAGDDPLYARMVLATPEVARLKPALAEQARERWGARTGEGADQVPRTR